MLRLAWRNLLRNTRRSLINAAAMGFGLAAIMFGQSLLKSLQAQLVEKSTGSITGHLQVQRADVEENKFPDRYFKDADAVVAALAADPRVKVAARRIHLTGLVSSPTASFGALVCAVEPEKEKLITSMSGYIKEGGYLEGHPKGLVLGRKLATRLDVRLGEKLVVMAQAADGSMGAEAFRVVGIHETGSESFDGQIIWVQLAAMQELLARPGQANHVVARLHDIEDAPALRAGLGPTLPPGLRALTWKDIDHEIVGVQAFQDAILRLVLMVVFLIVALGILNTQLMSLFERVREFGVLMAVGARPRWVMRLILIESFLLGLCGTAFGLVLGAALIAHFGRTGLHLAVGDAFSYFLPFPSVIYMRPAWGAHLEALGAVLLTSLLAAVPPALRAQRLKPAEALRHV